MLDNSLLCYYGLASFNGVNLQSYQFDYFDSIENIIDVIELSNLLKKQAIVLLISTRAATIVEQKTPLSILFKKRFGLLCDLLFEHQIKTFEGMIRICAVKVQASQFHVVLKILLDHSSCSFAFAVDEPTSSDTLSRLAYMFDDGLLTPKATKACANAVLNNNASFLHVLRGFDGYSVNYISRQHT